MHPTLNYELARHRQAELRREGAQARLARQVRVESTSEQAPARVRRHLRRRAISFGRPVLGQ